MMSMGGSSHERTNRHGNPFPLIVLRTARRKKTGVTGTLLLEGVTP